MGNITVEFPEDVLIALGQSREDFSRQARFVVAVKLFAQGRLSSGKAAKVCEMDRVEFLLSASREGVAVADLDEEEMNREFGNG